MKASKSLLTKVAKGVAYGDVSNQAIRNILTELSKKIAGSFIEQEMYDTLDYFDWKCPYTDRDLRKSLEDEDGSYATDHIYPQNRDWCGLNVKGNLIIVDRAANSAKRAQDVETFLLTDTKVLGNLDMETRQARLQKIKDFQKQCGYDPDKIRAIVSPILQVRYDEIRQEQEMCINHILDVLEAKGIQFIAMPPSAPTTLTTKLKTRHPMPELIFYPANEQEFKEELIRSKKAHFVLTYDSGAIKTSPWNANSFDSSSNLRGNIESRPFWRRRRYEGLVKVEVYID